MQKIMEKQLSIFDIPIMRASGKGIIDEINELTSQYLIDSHYRKITFGRTLTLHEIEEKLMRFKKFPEYIDKLYSILAKYYDEIEEFETITDFQTIGIAKRENCIRIYQPRHQYCVWCAAMIDEKFIDYAK